MKSSQLRCLGWGLWVYLNAFIAWSHSCILGAHRWNGVGDAFRWNMKYTKCRFHVAIRWNIIRMGMVYGSLLVLAKWTQMGPGPNGPNWDPGPIGPMGPGPNGPKWDPGPMGPMGPGPNGGKHGQEQTTVAYMRRKPGNKRCLCVKTRHVTACEATEVLKWLE